VINDSNTGSAAKGKANCETTHADYQSLTLVTELSSTKMIDE
jgi:hypothetical protein